MEPIINPWFFYLVDKADIIIAFSVIISTTSLVVSFFMFAESDEESSCYSEEFNKKIRDNKSLTKKIFILGISFLFIAILTPSSETIYKMQAAKYVTPNNIKEIANTADENVDILINKIIEANKKFDNSREK